MTTDADYKAADHDALTPDEANAAPRSLDDFLQNAYNNTAAVSFQPGPVCQQICRQWRYMLIVTALGISSAADAAEMFTIGYVLGDPGFQEEILRGDLAAGGALVAGILNLGLIIGGLVAGTSEGRMGRRTTMLGGLLVTSLAGFGCAVVPNMPLFALFRFVAGLGIGPILASTAPLATELSPPRERGFVVSVANSFWTVGLITNAIWAFVVFAVLDLSWRVFMCICTLPSVLGFLLISWLVPESPRFLALQGQYDWAAHCANRVARSMGYRGKLLRDTEMEHHFSGSARRGGVALQPTGLWDKVHHGMEKIHQVYKKDLRRPTLIIQTLWIAASCGGALGQWLVALFHKLDLKNIYLNFVFLNCACVPGNIASAFLTDRIGRNKFFTGAMLLTSTALFGTAGVVWSAGDDLGSRTGAIVACISFFYASMTGMYTCLYVMAAELFPTNVRSTGVALCSTFGRIAGVISMFVIGALVDTPAVLLSFGASVLLAGAIVSFVVPPNEMKLKPVEDDEHASEEEHFEDEPSIALQGRRGSELKYLAG